ncbi:hypothetical protein [Methanolobus profundi]|uniref:Uncharacterized protein n=1 Tax=Methanolobus profundi TaxID=487685 RepID=A0A1I4S340_9EURY|nr:hypothetical protein [Methanolobus profundi]SFM58926.1 hypothetical protein SAMN04488696_1744 [Methanolobus profundi]
MLRKRYGYLISLFIALVILTSGCVKDDQSITSRQEVLQNETHTNSTTNTSNIDNEVNTSIDPENEISADSIEIQDPYEIRVLKLDEYFTLPELTEIGTNTKMSQFGVITYADRLEETADGGYLLQGHTLSENISFWIKNTDVKGNQNWAKTYSKNNFTEITGIEEINEEYAIFGKNNGSAKIVFLNSDGNQVYSKEYNDFNMKNALKTTGGYLLLGSSKTTILEGHMYRDYQHLVVVGIDNDLNELWREKYSNITASGTPKAVHIENSTYLVVGDNNGIPIETELSAGNVTDKVIIDENLLNDTIKENNAFVINDKYVSKTQDYYTTTLNIVDVDTNEKISYTNHNYNTFDGPYCIKEAYNGYTLIEAVGTDLYFLPVNESGAINKNNIITKYTDLSQKMEYMFIQFNSPMRLNLGDDVGKLFGRYGILPQYFYNEAYIPTNTSYRIMTVKAPINIDITTLPKELNIHYIGQVSEEHKNGVPENTTLDSLPSNYKSSDGNFMYFELSTWDDAEFEEIETFFLKHGFIETSVEESDYDGVYNKIELVFPANESYFKGYYGKSWDSAIFAYPDTSLIPYLLEFDEIWYVGLYEVKLIGKTVPEKPAVYLYPEQNQSISVKLNINGEITEDIPEYNSGWNVYATSDGIIYERGQAYDYLFYECTLNSLELPSEGWCVSYDDLPEWFDENLIKLGLNDKEKRQFEEYWLNRLPEEEYYTIKILDDEFLNTNMGLDVSPKPDTVIRIEFVFKSSNIYVELEEPEITVPQRNGFVVVEWGGIVT